MAAIFQTIFSNAFSLKNKIKITAVFVLLKCVPKCPVYNISAPFQIIAWRRPGASHYLNHECFVH